MGDEIGERPGSGGRGKADVRYHDEGDGSFSMSEASHMRYWNASSLAWERVTGSSGAILTTGGGGGGGSVAIAGMTVQDSAQAEGVLGEVLETNNALWVVVQGQASVVVANEAPIAVAESEFPSVGQAIFDTSGTVSLTSRTSTKVVVAFDFDTLTAVGASIDIHRIVNGDPLAQQVKGNMLQMNASDAGSVISLETPITASGVYLIDSLGCSLYAQASAITSGFVNVNSVAVGNTPYLPV